MKIDLKGIIRDTTSILKKNRLLIAAMLFASLLSFIAKNENHEPPSPDLTASVNADTLIPKGYVLIPIEISNQESVSSILGSFGVVDVFSHPNEPSKKPNKIASQVKIIRAPNNQNQFAVLIPESQSAQFINVSGPYFVVIQNPSQQRTTLIQDKKKEKKVTYEEIMEAQ